MQNLPSAAITIESTWLRVDTIWLRRKDGIFHLLADLPPSNYRKWGKMKNEIWHVSCSLESTGIGGGIKCKIWPKQSQLGLGTSWAWEKWYHDSCMQKIYLMNSNLLGTSSVFCKYFDPIKCWDNLKVFLICKSFFHSLLMKNLSIRIKKWITKPRFFCFVFGGYNTQNY